MGNVRIEKFPNEEGWEINFCVCKDAKPENSRGADLRVL